MAEWLPLNLVVQLSFFRFTHITISLNTAELFWAISKSFNCISLRLLNARTSSQEFAEKVLDDTSVSGKQRSLTWLGRCLSSSSLVSESLTSVSSSCWTFWAWTISSLLLSKLTLLESLELLSLELVISWLASQSSTWWMIGSQNFAHRFLTSFGIAGADLAPTEANISTTLPPTTVFLQMATARTKPSCKETKLCSK